MGAAGDGRTAEPAAGTPGREDAANLLGEGLDLATGRPGAHRLGGFIGRRQGFGAKEIAVAGLVMAQLKAAHGELRPKSACRVCRSVRLIGRSGGLGQELGDGQGEGFQVLALDPEDGASDMGTQNEAEPPLARHAKGLGMQRREVLQVDDLIPSRPRRGILRAASRGVNG